MSLVVPGKVDTQKFLVEINKTLLRNRMTVSQKEGLLAKCQVWNESEFVDLRWFAYMLATSYHETGGKLIPVREIGQGRGHAYGRRHPVTGQIYYGRGDVQLTWYDNYLAMGKLLGYDLVNNPDLALQPKISMEIMFEGMTTSKSFKGDFTGKHLGMYFTDTKDDPINARYIINGRKKGEKLADKAEVIASYHYKFLNALKLSIQANPQMSLFDADQAPRDPEVQYDDSPASLQPTLDLEPELTDETTVYAVQCKLRELGWYEVGDTDKKIGERTRGAIKLAQEANGLVADGRITKSFLEALATFPPRDIAVTRANADAKTLAPKVEGVAVTRKNKFKSAIEAWFYGVTAFVTWLWVQFKSYMGGITKDTIEFVSSMPLYVWPLIAFGFAIAGYAWSKRGEEVQVEDYNKGKRL